MTDPQFTPLPLFLVLMPNGHISLCDEKGRVMTGVTALDMKGRRDDGGPAQVTVTVDFGESLRPGMFQLSASAPAEEAAPAAAEPSATKAARKYIDAPENGA